MEITGGCLCGAARFRLTATLTGFYLCHCVRCQKSSGSAHGSNLFFKETDLVWTQGESTCADYQLAGTRFSKRFCKVCASPLPRVIDETSKVVQVPAGCLDGNELIEPTAHLFIDKRKCWEDKLPTTKKFHGLPQ